MRHFDNLHLEFCYCCYFFRHFYLFIYLFFTLYPAGADLGGGCRGAHPPPPEMTCGFLINTVQSASQLYKICFII